MCNASSAARTLSAARRRGFSLIELLLAVFILAIGIISISALFPAGIAQQQAANDDQLGPVVAEQALGTLRSRLKPEDFGTFEEFGIFNVLQQAVDNNSYVYRPAPGDWSWIRPGIILNDVPATVPDDRGAVDIFSAGATPPNSVAELTEFPDGMTSPTFGGSLRGIPYNTSRSAGPPAILVTQRERYWPSIPEGQAIVTPAPYVWDVMFRRFGGKVQVAIFVYRVVGSGGSARAYIAKANPLTPGQPPVPFRRVPISTAASATSASTGPATGLQVRTGWQQSNGTPALPNDSIFMNGTLGSAQGLFPADIPAGQLIPIQNSWQQPGQWLLDGNGNVHRVTQGRRTFNDPVLVRLSAPATRVPVVQAFDDYELPNTASNDPVPQGIRTIFFVPLFDADNNQLVPVYATVREL